MQGDLNQPCRKWASTANEAECQQSVQGEAGCAICDPERVLARWQIFDPLPVTSATTQTVALYMVLAH